MKTPPKKFLIRKQKYPNSFEGMTAAELANDLRDVLAEYHIPVETSEKPQPLTSSGVTVWFIM